MKDVKPLRHPTHALLSSVDRLGDVQAYLWRTYA